MKITGEQADAAVLKELGGRIARYRLHRGLSQDTLAHEAGLSLNPVRRIERGESVQTASLLRVLRVLGLLDNLDVIVPEPTISPMRLLKQQGNERQRAPRQSNRPGAKAAAVGSGAASHPDSPNRKTKQPWTWGDEK